MRSAVVAASSARGIIRELNSWNHARLVESCATRGNIHRPWNHTPLNSWGNAPRISLYNCTMTLLLRSIVFFVLIGCITACSPFKQALISIEKTTDVEGLIKVNHERMSVQLFGDYLIHPLKEKLTMNWDQALHIELFHIDYFLETDYGTYRFSFWSSDRDRKWLFRESTSLLEKLKLAQP